jgi:site-specific DNA-methyltransferase (cytosine-N4-specific)
VTVTLKCRVKPYIQPFERKLALAELSSLTHSTPRSDGSDTEALEFEVQSALPADVLASKLAYWEFVFDSRPHITIQALREATVNVVRNGIPLEKLRDLVPFKEDKVPLPNRRCLRYGAHGIHEYRGKFFPQLVRSLFNIAKVPAGGVVADPMAGSGTTIAEAVLAGCQAIGLDINPLSVLMGRTKCALLSITPKALETTYEETRKRLLRATPVRVAARLPYFASLPYKDQEYLKSWFSRQVLSDLDQIAQVIQEAEDGPVRDLMRLSLSNIIRSVSWQKDDDLRVRKEIRMDDDTDPIKEFLDELGSSVRTVLAFLYQNRDSTLGSFVIEEGNACLLDVFWNNWQGKVDVVVTSPPYATALPYLDTDRLSLCYLDLLTRPEHRKRDLQMIGNREITEGQRRAQWRYFQEKKELLPNSVVDLVEKVHLLNSTTEVGFRRKNLPTLLAKYFFDMRDVLRGIAYILKPGAPAYVVVGNNHTIAGGERVEIDTASLLVDIAQNVGLVAGEHISMEMLVSRDIFKKNAVASEVILSFRRSV